MDSSRRSLFAMGAGYMVLLTVLLLALAVIEPVRVSGGSMRPALRSADIVFVRKTHQVSKGDIILIRRPGHEAVLHRVVDTEANGSLITQGDANDIADREPVAVRHVSGRVVAVMPVGAFIEWWRTR